MTVLHSAPATAVFKYVLHGCARFGAMHFCEALSLSVVMLEINSNWGGHG